MPDPRQIIDLPVATEADDVDLLLMRQGLFDKQVEVNLIRDGLLRSDNNLSDIDDAATARNNLGIDLGDFLLAANNLSDIDDPATAVANLGIDTSDFLQSNNNLSDLDNVSAARANLDVSSSSETLLVANNLSDLGDASAARGNLSVSATAETLLVANNLSDLDNAATARGNLDVTASAITAVTNDDNTFNFNQQNEMQIINYSETGVDVGNLGTSHSFDLEDGNVHIATANDDVTISFANPPLTGQAGSLFIILSNGGDHAITWPGSVVWTGGTAPTLTESGTDLLVFTTVNNGSTWYGALAGLDMS